jgi:hypothetical protein
MAKGIKVGRRQFDGKNEATVLQKLDIAFSMGCTDEEACLFANISKSALYEYQKKKPEFLEQKELSKFKPILKARMTVVDNLDKDPNFAFKFLERKKRDEFGSGAYIPFPSHQESSEAMSEEQCKELDNLKEILMSHHTS